MGYARVWFAGRPADRRHFCNALCHALPPDIRSTQMTQDEFSAVIELRPGLLWIEFRIEFIMCLTQ